MELTKLDNLILKLATLGLSKREISSSLNMTLLDLDRMIKRNKVLEEAFNFNVLNADFQVMRSLFKRAVGTKRKIRKVRTVEKIEDSINPKDGQVEALAKKETITDEITEEIVGDVSAQKYWLNNRRPDLFSDISLDKMKQLLEDS